MKFITNINRVFLAALSIVMLLGTGSISAASHCQCVQYVVNRFGLSSGGGNAEDWNDGYLHNNGFVQVPPTPGAIVVMESSFTGFPNGHVSVLEEIYANGKISTRGSNQANQATNSVTEYNCNNVTSIGWGKSVFGRTDISFWVHQSLLDKTKFSDRGMLNGAFGEAGRGDKVFVGHFNESKSVNPKNDILQIVTRGTHTEANPGFYTLKADGYYGRQFTTSANLAEAREYFTGDVDGDGFTDLIFSSGNLDGDRIVSYNWKWLRNNQYGTFNSPLVLNSSYGMTGDRFYALDFNGDGKVDILNATPRLSPDGNMAWYAMISNGSSFVDAGRIYSGFFGHYLNTFLTGDVNGDGRDDIVAGVPNPADINAMTWYVMTSYGTYASVPSTPILVRDGIAKDSFFLVDATGDGKADLVTAEARTHADKAYNWRVAKSNGTNLSASTLWMSRYGIAGDYLLPGKFHNTNSFDFLNGNTRMGGAIRWYLMYGDR